MKSAVANVAGLLLMLNVGIGLLGLALLVVVGAWDLVVWLTRADWRTTGFVGPTIGLACVVAAIVLNKGVLTPLLDWAEKKR